jgi:hypothetical protein
MALPVNKKILDSTIVTNLPINNGQQLITAEKLQQTLTPIVNSTFGLKTIWAGYMFASINLDNVYPSGPFPTDPLVSPSGTTLENALGVFVQERYYDPNYFPALDPNSLDTVTYSLASYQAAGCRYKITNVGANLVNGTFYNVATQIKNTTENTSFVGTGLTFDVTVEAGALRAIKVNNPGTGYCWGRGTGGPTSTYASEFKSSIVEILLNYTGAGPRPQVTIDLSRVVDLDRGLIALSSTSGGYGYARNKALNLFIPNAGPSIGYGPVVNLGSGWVSNPNTANSNEPEFPSNYYRNLPTQNPQFQTFSLKNPPFACNHDANFNTYFPNSTGSPTVKGYYKKDMFFLDGGIAYNSADYFLEVKVPITNTTI